MNGTASLIITICGLLISIMALIVSIFAAVASAFFYFKSTQQLKDYTRRLQTTMNVLGHYLKATIKDAHVDLNLNRNGDIIGLNISGRSEVSGGGSTSSMGFATKGDSKQD